LSPFYTLVIIWCIFQSWEILCFERLKENKWWIGTQSEVAQFLRILKLISSAPIALVGSNAVKASSTSWYVTWILLRVSVCGWRDSVRGYGRTVHKYRIKVIIKSISLV